MVALCFKMQLFGGLLNTIFMADFPIQEGVLFVSQVISLRYKSDISAMSVLASFVWGTIQRVG